MDQALSMSSSTRIISPSTDRTKKRVRDVSAVRDRDRRLTDHGAKDRPREGSQDRPRPFSRSLTPRRKVHVPERDRSRRHSRSRSPGDRKPSRSNSRDRRRRDEDKRSSDVQVLKTGLAI